ncbi:MAG: S-layer homology domain-containing protein [Acidaminococcaceae bacterium]|nr:S-layer homology domain-containing protein [Acidaminococcaceae bacterium]
MKKSLVLAMAMALGVTASAYAANPFSDVPAGHWAYDSIAKLAAAGVIEGYGDDTFRGDRLMTRYEMAQIVAKAMAKGANTDKLAAEFADELDALGVRVAALEKKADNVKITGQFRYHYASFKDMAVSTDDPTKANSWESKLRSRIWFNGKVNDSWTYVGMLENQQDLTNNAGDETTNFQRAYLQGRLGGLKTVAGRMQKGLFENTIYGTRMDGLDFTYGKAVKLNAYYGKPTNANSYALGGAKPDKMYGANLSGDFKGINVYAGYDHFDSPDSYYKDDKIIHAGAKFKFGKDINLAATYLHTSNSPTKYGDQPDNGFVIGLDIKGAKAAKPGTWGLGVKYYHAPAGVSVGNGWDSSRSLANGDKGNYGFYASGFKGWYAVAKYTVAKNMVAGVEYWDLEGRGYMDGLKAKTLWSELVVSF